MMTPPSNKIEIKPSSISGKGTFAIEPIAKGEYITTLTGELVHTKDINKLSASLGLAENDPLQIEDETFIFLDYESKVINHACTPNAGIRNKSDLYALRDISVGEEITYDYSTTVGTNDSLNMTCSCHSSQCRQTIGNILTIPTATLKQYRELDALPAFIKRQLARL